MKSLILLIALIPIVFCLTKEQPKQVAHVLKYENDITLNGYNFGYETSDGITRNERAEVKNLGGKDENLSIQGSYSWVDKDGNQYVVNYVADENGFQPEGDHIPHLYQK